MKYKVTLKEVLTYEVEVEADTEEQAIKLAKDDCSSDCLINDNYLGYELIKITIKGNENEKI